MRALLAAGLFALCGVASAQAPGIARYSGPGGIPVEVQTVQGRKVAFVQGLRFGSEAVSVLTFTLDVAPVDAQVLGTARAGLLPGVTNPVALFQVSPGAATDYSPTLTRLCGGTAGVPMVGIENGADAMRAHGFDRTRPVILHVFESTFVNGALSLRLCGTMALEAR